jgi:hypothetical protein
MTHGGEEHMAKKMKQRQWLVAYVPHTLAMIESPAWQALSLSARRVLDRIEIENMHHVGQANGELPVTFDNLEEYGVHRHGIAPAIRELEALGFIEITRRGRAGNADQRKASTFRLTYLRSGKRDSWVDPTDEWKRFKSIQDAERVAVEARKTTSKPKRKKQKPVAETTTAVSVETTTGKRKSPVVDSATTRRGGNHTTLLYSGLGGGRSGGERGGNDDRPKLKFKSKLGGSRQPYRYVERTRV